MIRSVATALLLASSAAAALAPGHAEAQELRVDVARVHADHDLLGTSTALGGSLGVGLGPWIGVRLGVQHGEADFTSVGTTCVGLVFPDEDCSPEPRNEESTTTALFLGVPLTASLQWGRLGLVPGVRRLTMKSRQEGTTSGRVRAADEVAYGWSLGAEIEVSVWDRPAVALHAGLHTARHPWFEKEIIADGYAPFEDPVRLTWLELGLTLRR